ncbi:kinase domain [Thalictrum thalictroides]|uniref:Kinase domain n=2 Tax=Thalictrum thalictroides TaxID=46969 RepID=A0A7J6VDI4_THATH|nr:kinase domain [Thalictrum thalictroides]
MDMMGKDQGRKRVKLFILGFLIILLFFKCSSTFGQTLVPLSSDLERQALLDLRSSLGIRARDWPRKSDPCLVWIGVQCQQDGRVVGINVSGFRRTRLGRQNPQFAVDSLLNFTLLASFNASGFLLPGSIPDWFGQRMLSLQVLDLRSCSVLGSIPWSLGNLTSLNVLYLSSNSLTGTIPSSLGQLSRLSELDLSQNSFTGSFPLSFSLLLNLTLLDLSSNYLSGSIPSVLGNLTNLQKLNLSNNSLSAPIPTELGELSALVDLDLGLNPLSGSLPENLFSNLTRLQVVVLSHNSLSGALPDLLWSMPRLSFLDVSYNNFTGVLPNSSSPSNATFATFNLSHNNFFGNLTSQKRRFSFIDLSDNYFEGKVVDNIRGNASLSTNCLQNVSNQRSLMDCTLFYSQRGLIFDNFGNPNNTTPPGPEPHKKSNRRLVFILAGVFGGLGFIVLLVLFLVFCLRRRERGDTDQRGRSVGPSPEGGSPPPPTLAINFSNLGEAFTYEQLMRATSGFSDSNLIKHGHSGDLFRGSLESGGAIVVKRIDVRSLKKESYMVELDLFSRALHPRFVPLLGHCLEHENDKIIVYKYMPNGDLSNSLYRKSEHEDDSLQSLDWITRLKIAIGAAEGLSYLHHECSPPLVHRDVQASSILLDDKFEVRLGSLSEVCKQEGDNHQNVITRLLRLPQTSEQGSSGSMSASCAYDVYCFGKVLLELVTGKLGMSASDNATTNEWLEKTLPHINIYERELVTKIVDPSLIVDEDLLEEVWAMAVVAKSCLNPKPSKRPLMRYILKALENPLKVVREENSGSARLRTTSSRGSWNAAVFGSWRHSSSEIAGIPGPSIREGSNSLKQSGAGSQGSGACGGGDHSSSNKKLSRDVFPEPMSDVDIERQNESS